MATYNEALVICRYCKGKYHKIKRVGFVKPYNGTMFEMLEPYKTSYAWTDFPKQPNIIGVNLECPKCNQPYIDMNGDVLLDRLHVGKIKDKINAAAKKRERREEKERKQELVSVESAA